MTRERPRSRLSHDDNDREIKEGWREHEVQPEAVTIDITRERQGAFNAVLANAEKGTRILYHLGPHCAGAHRLDARAAYDAGRVVLTLRKRDRSIFEYLAIPVTPKST